MLVLYPPPGCHKPHRAKTAGHNKNGVCLHLSKMYYTHCINQSGCERKLIRKKKLNNRNNLYTELLKSPKIEQKK